MLRILPLKRTWLSYGVAWFSVLLGLLVLVFSAFAMMTAFKILSLSTVLGEVQYMAEHPAETPRALLESVGFLMESRFHGLETVDAFSTALWKYLIIVGIVSLASFVTLPWDCRATRRLTGYGLVLAFMGVAIAWGANVWCDSEKAVVSSQISGAEARLESGLSNQSALVAEAAREARNVEYLFAGFGVAATSAVAALCYVLIAAAFPARWR